MSNPLYNRDIISVQDFNAETARLILKKAAQLKAKPNGTFLKEKLIATCFFEPSTRTRLSFTAAVLRQSGQVMGFSNGEETSVKKGETLSDSIRVISEYADLIVIRHPQEGAARLAAEVSAKPVINAGDGANQHPTQALIDLFSIQECQKKLQGLNIAVVGDLKYGRAVHSFVQACAFFDNRLYFVSPELMNLPEQLAHQLKRQGVRFSFHQKIEEVIPRVDVLYMSRVQQERFSKMDYPHYGLTLDVLSKAKDNLKILHPLPRVKEIDRAIDNTPYAYYFTQAANGVCVRQALLTLLLNK